MSYLFGTSCSSIRGTLCFDANGFSRLSFLSHSLESSSMSGATNTWQHVSTVRHVFRTVKPQLPYTARLGKYAFVWCAHGKAPQKALAAEGEKACVFGFYDYYAPPVIGRLQLCGSQSVSVGVFTPIPTPPSERDQQTDRRRRWVRAGVLWIPKQKTIDRGGRTTTPHLVWFCMAHGVTLASSHFVPEANSSVWKYGGIENDSNQSQVYSTGPATIGYVKTKKTNDNLCTWKWRCHWEVFSFQNCCICFFYNSVEAKSHCWLSNVMFIVVFFYCLLQILTRTKYVVRHFGKQWAAHKGSFWPRIP